MTAQITLKRAQVQSLVDFAKARNISHWFIAKDQGAYVGASAGMKDGKADNILFYFAGCNPETDADWYDTAHDKFGGDDFGERMPLTSMTDALADATMESMRIKVNASSISIQTMHTPLPKVVMDTDITAPDGSDWRPWFVDKAAKVDHESVKVGDLILIAEPMKRTAKATKAAAFHARIVRVTKVTLTANPTPAMGGTVLYEVVREGFMSGDRDFHAKAMAKRMKPASNEGGFALIPVTLSYMRIYA